MRIDDAVHRPTGPWTAGVHALLGHLEQQGFDAPRVRGIDEQGREVLDYVTLFRNSYGHSEFPDDLLAVAAERCAQEADLIDRLGAAGEPPYDRLLREGHSEIWHAAEAHVVEQTPDWQAALNLLE